MPDVNSTVRAPRRKRDSLKIGQVFHRLTIIGPPESHKRPCGDTIVRYLCRCECGNISTVNFRQLADGLTHSCGCLQKEAATRHISQVKKTHGKSQGRLYQCYDNMRARCLRLSCRERHNYGGRGITFCPEWEDFETFESWALANGYEDHLTLDRADPNGNYCPENCRWVTKQVQARTLRKCIRLTAFGETKVLREWGRDPRCKVNLSSLRFRLAKGWTLERALTTPPSERHARNATAGRRPLKQLGLTFDR